MNEIPPLVVVDASVVLKWFLSEREPRLAAAMGLLSMHMASDLLLASPDLLRLEILNGVRRRGYAAEAIVRIADTLGGLRLEWYRIDDPLARMAASLVAKHQITPYDATYCALARALDTELITDDRRLAASGACTIRLLGDSSPLDGA